MKGLMLREWKLARKSIFLIIAIFFAMLTIHIMFLLSYRFGNLSHGLTRDQLDVKKAIEKLYYFEMILLMLSASGFISNIFNDIKGHWMTYSYTLPGGIRRSVTAKYLCITIVQIVGFALGCILAIIVSAIAGKSLTADNWFLMVLVGLLCVIIFAVTVVISYVMKNPDKVASFWFMLGVLGSGALCIVINRAEDEKILLEMMEWGMKAMKFLKRNIVLLFLGVVALDAASYWTSVKIMLRKEK